jgi:Domain of unknown function (DUF3291)
LHLAQLNIARAQAPLDSAQMAEFMANLDPVNALADSAPGFVWRLQDDDSGNATSIRPFDDDLMIVNLSVWESIDALWAFVYDGEHLEVMRRRREWFERFVARAYLVLWWLDPGHVPSVDEAIARLEHLDAHGPSPHAFTFKRRFAPGARAA